MDFECHSKTQAKSGQRPNYDTCHLDVEYLSAEVGLDTKEIKFLEINGISNIGNTCYANALFQSLASVRCFVDYVKDRCKGCKRIPVRERKLVKRLYRILLSLKVEPGEVDDNSWYRYFFSNGINRTTEVKKTINVSHVKFFLDNFEKFNLNAYQQNCPFELLQGIFEILEELNPGNGDSLDSNGTKGRDIDNPFKISEVETKICNACNNTETTKVPSNPFIMIPLTRRNTFTIDNLNNHNYVKPLMGRYFSNEHIESYTCEKCKIKSSMTKFRRLTAYPKALLLHFGRKFLNHVAKEKIQFEEELTFEDEWLDTSSNDSDCNDAQTGKRYTLKSIVRHISFGNGGHYIAYRFVSGNDYYGKMENCKLVDRWIRVNDDSLCEINFKDTVQKCEAYMAFYEAL